MKVYSLAFYFFFWTAIKIDVSVATESKPLFEDDKSEQNPEKIQTMDSYGLSEDISKMIDESCKPSQSTEEGAEFLVNVAMYNILEKRKDAAYTFHNIIQKYWNFNNTILSLERLNMSDLSEAIMRVIHNLDLQLSTRIKDLKIRISKTLPQLKNSERNSLSEQYNQYRKLNWSYSNSEIVSEADEVTASVFWNAQTNPDDKVLNDRMYHHLNTRLSEMKEHMLCVESDLLLATELQNIIGRTNPLIKELTPSDANKLKDTALSKVHRYLMSLQKLLKSSQCFADFVANKQIIDEAVNSLKKWIHDLDRDINTYIVLLKSSSFCVTTESDLHILRNMLFQYLSYNDNVIEDGRNIRKRGRIKLELNDFADKLQEVYGRLIYSSGISENLLQDMYNYYGLRFFYMKNFSELQMEHNKKEDKLYGSLADLMNMIAHIAEYKSYASGALKLVESFKEAFDSVKYQKSFTQKDLDGQLDIIKLIYRDLNKYVGHIGWLYNAVDASVKLEAVLKKYKMHESVLRRLQYFWGTACQVSKNVVTDKLNKKKKKERETALKYIASALYNSILTMEELEGDASGF